MTNQIKNSKIIFFGTPEVSAQVLTGLVDAGYDIALVVTNPDQPVGRKHVITPPPVKVVAERCGIPVLQPAKLNQEFLHELMAKGQGLMAIVVAYGKIIPQTIIDSFPIGMLNIHYSLLPKYRGASPVEQSILSGDTVTGVTIQKLVFKLDAGPIIGVREVPIDERTTTPELKNLLTGVGIELLLEILPKYIAGEITPIEQDESLATHCGKIDKADGEIKLSDDDHEKWRKYKAYYGWPGVFYFDEAGKRVKVTGAEWIEDQFIIKKIIPEGKNEISI
jgi:methionyl-tRNA formyltransferase